MLCKGRGKVACGGCGGPGRQSCGACGARGTVPRTVMRSRWNGRHHESYPETVYESCVRCSGSGRVVCYHCGGSGTQRCRACAGHGFFTDTAHVTAIARAQWQVSGASGLAAGALQAGLLRLGPAHARTLVPLGLVRMGYDEEKQWLVDYEGRADVVELDVAVRQAPYVVAAVGAAPTAITTPPIFDMLLEPELASARELLTRGKSRLARRRARQLFEQYRRLPAVDASLQAMAPLKGQARAHPHRAVHRALGGFVSADAASTLSQVLDQVLHRVSPPYSPLAWAVMGAPVGLGAFIVVANGFSSSRHGDGVLNFVLPLLVATALSAAAMVAASLPAWLISVCLTTWAKQRIPSPYRQPSRNAAPFKKAVKVVACCAVAGALLGQAAHAGWFAPVLAPGEPMMAPIARAAVPHLPAALARELASLADMAPMTAMRPTRPAGPTRPLGPMAAARPADATTVPAVSDSVRVQAVQRRLIERGLLAGRADGVLGRQTLTAIERYKAQYHLSASLSLPELVADLEQRPR